MMRWWEQAGLELGHEDKDTEAEEEGVREEEMERAAEERQVTAE